MLRKGRIVGVLGLCGLAIVGCGSEDSTDPRLESMSEPARKAVGAVITESEPLRLKMASGSNVTVMGEDESEAPDLSKPEFILEVDSDKRIHSVVASDEPDGGTGIEMWSDGEKAVFNVSEDYASTLDDAGEVVGESQLTDALIELYQPGEFSVDLKTVKDSDVGADEVLATAIDSDPRQVFQTIGENFEAAEQVGDDKNLRRFETTLGEVVDSGSATGMMDALVGDEEAPMETEMMQDFVSQLVDAPTTVVMTLDDDGRVTDVELTSDLSDAMRAFMEGMFGAMGEDLPEGQAGDPDLIQDQLDQVMEGLRMEVIVMMTVEYDDSIKVEMPTDVSDDRTEAFLAAADALRTAREAAKTSTADASTAGTAGDATTEPTAA